MVQAASTASRRASASDLVIYAVIGAVIIGFSLGIIGSGGSILTVPVLLSVLHHHEKVAIAESLGIVGAIALVAALPYARRGIVDWRVAFMFGVPGMMGTYGGAWCASFVSGTTQLLVFAAVMLLASFFMWPRAKANTAEDEAGERGSRARRPSAILVIAEGLGVGVLTGFVGVGGGFMIVPSLALLTGLSMRRAVATSLVIIAMKSLTGFWKYLDVLADAELAVDWSIMGMFVVIGIGGSIIGERVNDRLNQTILRRIFAVFLVLMSVYVVMRSWV